jgi:hypothetical protein
LIVCGKVKRKLQDEDVDNYILETIGIDSLIYQISFTIKSKEASTESLAIGLGLPWHG